MLSPSNKPVATLLYIIVILSRLLGVPGHAFLQKVPSNSLQGSLMSAVRGEYALNTSMLLVCNFEVETDGKSIDILRVSFGDEENANAELYEDNKKEGDGQPPKAEDEDEGVPFKGLVSCE